ncbi:hypothetical protein CHS0354_000719 [Potamilus streckersoni]|uniref:Thioredoxin domain-containing protein n=1 Tax=Potamilus streckersoni TaxID=2493646 RepID=A0AAE0W7K2_9BIVA|nr:hypothetical protein CHS0354_000719 [Potamilus streckersoni]
MKVIFSFVSVILVGAIGYFALGKYKEYRLPEYGEVSSFVLTNQQGESFISNEKLKGKVYAVNFFFTTCTSICPKMTSNIKRAIYDNLKSKENFSLVSISVDPERDSAQTLQRYANQFHIKENWDFLTGEKSKIYLLARNDYKLIAAQTGEDVGDFIHSDKIILIDKNNQIRACHKANSDKFIGPGLRGIEQRRPLDWIVKFVHNSDAVIKSGDEYAIKLFEEYNKMPMTPNPDLTESQIKNVLAYIKSEEIKENGEKDNKQSQTQVGGSGRNIVIMESFQSAKKQETVFSQAFVIFSAIIGLIFAFGMIYWIVGHTKKKS